MRAPYSRTLFDLLDEQAERCPERTAVIDESTRATYPALRDRALRVAGALAKIVTAFASERTKTAPDILTAREEGIDVVSGTTNLLAAPSGTPADKLEPIARAINRTMARQSLQDQLTVLGIQSVSASNPERAKAFVAAEVERWGRVVKKLNIAL